MGVFFFFFFFKGISWVLIATPLINLNKATHETWMAHLLELKQSEAHVTSIISIIFKNQLWKP